MSHVIFLTIVFICFALKETSFCSPDMDIGSVPGFDSSKEQPTNSGM